MLLLSRCCCWFVIVLFDVFVDVLVSLSLLLFCSFVVVVVLLWLCWRCCFVGLLSCCCFDVLLYC